MLTQYPNPYAAPETEPERVEAHATTDEHAVLFAWEWLRVYFNAALMLAVLLPALPTMARVGLDLPWVEVVIGLTAANVCFCLGPVLEAYVVWMGLRTKWARWTIFLIGTVFSTVVTFLSAGITFTLWNP